MGALLNAMVLAFASGQSAVPLPVSEPVVVAAPAPEVQQVPLVPAAAPIPAAVPAVVSAPAEPAATTPPEAPAAPPVAVTADPAAEAPADPGAITVTARSRNDPAQAVNAISFKVTQEFDNKLVGPVAKAYKKLLPKPARSGLHNVIRNLGEPVVALNYLLQLKPGKAAETMGRFVINTTLGVGGLMDVAKDKPFNLPYRHNSFANTLGYYGVGPGPYFYLPLVGSTTLRDMLGGAVDGMLLPVGIGAPFNTPYYAVPNGTIRSLDRRVEFDCQIKTLAAADDPYAATRAYYLKKRQAEIDALHGRGNGPPLLEQCRDQLSGDAKDEPVAAPAVAPSAAPVAVPAPETPPAPAAPPAAAEPVPVAPEAAQAAPPAG